MFYDNFHKLCKEKGVSCKQAAIDCGFSNSICTTWKQRGSAPKGEGLYRMAQYFNVTVEELLHGDEIAEKTEEQKQNEETMKYLEELKSNSSMRMLFHAADGASKDQIEAVAEMLMRFKGDR